ncbi:bifunctional folylpolyglutamate synthase/dihydrofolate synthase [Halieaceae bacterium IMCC14734]|uniref:Dihydrofolate synthase/folylpolyglutamate synthase n=1 Tax=Candidatus Litorirhabdus singularis TaxID=2518993 RepID=A0ABT3TH59_9GAMM|nr:bifunctional folylpolyglutamate synthase/dihydrofolate synthase [Candidatus Litorirhabdus singularis]MCX2981670.1 bifunctional folylpolyglutamate synthase/dihydrofolate synthase [Candidatus Litorirhabdus singularis]
MTGNSLPEWLEKLQALHPREIELGLDRVAEVAGRLDLLHPHCPVVTVAGTNGKGSTICVLDGLLRSGGHRTGRYTSPHLLRYNERICIDGEPVADAVIVSAFEQIEAHRGAVSLTYFEFSLLAALLVFRDPALDYILLEVGLGGRLDAVNIVDPNVAIVTAIDLDHQDWLGDTRDLIAVEKAGILRPGIPVICADLDPPTRLREEIQRQQCDCLYLDVTEAERFAPGHRLRPENVAAAWHAACRLGVEVPMSTVPQIAANSAPPGRLQSVAVGPVEVLMDVAHNPQAVGNLETYLRENPVTGRQIALFAALSDKDIHGMIQPCLEAFDAWFVAGLPKVERSCEPQQLAITLGQQGLPMISSSKNPRQAYRRAMSILQAGDRLVVFGSFYTVAEIQAVLVKDRSST